MLEQVVCEALGVTETVVYGAETNGHPIPGTTLRSRQTLVTGEAARRHSYGYSGRFKGRKDPGGFE